MTTKKWITNLIRWNFDNKNRQRLINNDVTIISSNCVGGVISHRLGLQFLSPTINLFLMPKDFIKFCSDLHHYIALTPTLITEESDTFPVASLGDIKLYAIHYLSFDDFKAAWEKRKKRINWQNISIMMTMRDGATMDDLKVFDALPYKNKVVFVPYPIPEISSSYVIPNTANNGEDKEHNKVKELTKYENRFTRRQWIDHFDYVRFLNEGCWWNKTEE